MVTRVGEGQEAGSLVVKEGTETFMTRNEANKLSSFSLSLPKRIRDNNA